MDNMSYTLSQMQLRRAIGELRAFEASLYRPDQPHGGSQYAEAHKFVEETARELRDRFG